MYEISSLKNGLTLITVNLPHLDSVTSLVAVGAGSRYETRKVSGISHFLEHMFFKGSRKYPTAEQIASIVDGMGAINNAATDKEVTYYWIKSSAKNLELSSDILSSMLKESILAEDEIEREKGVIIEEARMVRDDPARYIWDLYIRMQFGDQPLGWDTIGAQEAVLGLKRDDFIKYVDSLYAPRNMVLVFAGKLPKNIINLATESFGKLPKRSQFKPPATTLLHQTQPKVSICYRQTDQVNVILGMKGMDRYDKRKYALRVLSTILGGGMSSRLFIQVRERRGLAYHVSANNEFYKDAGAFMVYAGLKLEKVIEGIEVIKAELERLVLEKATDDELKKGKEMIRGRLALRAESTNFLAEYFGIDYVLDRCTESFDEYLKKIDQVTSDDIRSVAADIIKKERYNLQIVGPFKEPHAFERTLKR